MRRKTFLSVAIASLVLFFCPSCDNKPTPEEIKVIAGQAGEIAALTYLSIEKPTKEQATAIKIVVDEITKNLKAYQEGGFIKALPDIEKLIDKEIPVDKNKAANILAKRLASLMLTELDILFEKHPDWKTKGAEVADIVASFTTGASKGFDAYIDETSKMYKKMEAPKKA